MRHSLARSIIRLLVLLAFASVALRSLPVRTACITATGSSRIRLLAGQHPSTM